ncbi:MAG: molybdopterin-dependent oxidoreductase [Thermodesulfovibrionales bacterium]|nr:molybdopterin-dependent oxidoreductase [Thermodesulfovibrionales bacterium]
MITIKIDGKTIKANEGDTILNSALKSGIYIPNLCHDRRLKPFGACRLCIVEVSGHSKLLPACSTPVSEGMLIKTETPEIIKARKTVLELLLIHHPLDCPVCDKAGECTLQDLVFKYGASSNRFEAKRRSEPERLDAPIVEYNPNRCVLCGRCVRICLEHQGVGAISFIDKGIKTTISPAFHEPLDCEFCGQCIDTCPVGALGSKHYRHSSRTWYMDEKSIICPFCGCGCSTNLSIREGKIIRARGIEGVGINKGDLCSKGRYGFDYIASDNRLKTPLIKKDGEFVSASWEEAIKTVANKFQEIKNKYGAFAIGAIGSQRCTLEDNFMLQRFMREVIRTDNIDSAARFGYAKAQTAFEWAFGLDSLPIRWNSPLEADYILVIESDITSTMPVWGLNFIMAKNRGAQLVVADSRETKLARNSTNYLKIKPSTGLALLGSMAYVIHEEGLYDRASVSRIHNYDAFVASISDYAPSKVKELIGLSETEIIDTAREYASAKSRMIAITSGYTENTKSLYTFLAAANLLLLLGDKPETLQVPAEFPNTLGMWDITIRPLVNGKDCYDMLYSNDNPKALFVMGENPLVSFPDSLTVEKTLKKIEFLLVQDIYLTDTAKLAHVVLPASSWAEKEGTFKSATGLHQKISKILDGPGISRPDWEIIRDIAYAMGGQLNVNKISDVRRQMNEYFSDVLDKHIRTGLAFNPAPYKLIDKTDSDYPLYLVTETILQHSGSLSVLSKNLDSVVSEPYIQINPNDAEQYGISHDQFLRVTSRKGSIILKAIVTEEVERGTVFTNTHFSYGKVNILTYPSVVSMLPLVPVRIEPA